MWDIMTADESRKWFADKKNLNKCLSFVRRTKWSYQENNKKYFGVHTKGRILKTHQKTVANWVGNCLYNSSDHWKVIKLQTLAQAVKNTNQGVGLYKQC